MTSHAPRSPSPPSPAAPMATQGRSELSSLLVTRGPRRDMGVLSRYGGPVAVESVTTRALHSDPGPHHGPGSLEHPKVPVRHRGSVATGGSCHDSHLRSDPGSCRDTEPLQGSGTMRGRHIPVAITSPCHDMRDPLLPKGAPVTTRNRPLLVPRSPKAMGVN